MTRQFQSRLCSVPFLYCNGSSLCDPSFDPVDHDHCDIEKTSHHVCGKFGVAWSGQECTGDM